MNGIFDIINAAGLTVAEAAELFEVTRATIYNWESGMKPKSSAVYRRAIEKCVVIKAATRAGRFPLRGGLTPEARRNEIRRTLLEVVRSMKRQ